MWLLDALGIIGVTLSLFAHWKVQEHKYFARSKMYPAMNLVASLLMGISLLVSFNLAAAILTIVRTMIDLRSLLFRKRVRFDR